MLEYWDTKPHVREAGGDGDWYDWHKEIPARSAFSEILIAETDGRPVGVVQIIDPKHEESHYWGDVPDNLRAIDIWIGEEHDLGRGLGTQMMQLALARCFAPAEVTAVLLDPLAANTRAHAFYERLGFEKIDERRFGNDSCLVYALTRERFESTSEA